DPEAAHRDGGRAGHDRTSSRRGGPAPRLGGTDSCHDVSEPRRLPACLRLGGSAHFAPASSSLQRRNALPGEKTCEIGDPKSVFYGGMRPLRHVPRERCLFEVTVRTVQARFLLRPSVALNEIILGVLGRAQRIYGAGAEICAFAFVSNHFHLL